MFLHCTVRNVSACSKVHARFIFFIEICTGTVFWNVDYWYGTLSVPIPYYLFTVPSSDKSRFTTRRLQILNIARKEEFCTKAWRCVLDPEWFFSDSYPDPDPVSVRLHIMTSWLKGICSFKLSIFLRNCQIYQFFRVVLLQVHYGSGASWIRILLKVFVPTVSVSGSTTLFAQLGFIACHLLQPDELEQPDVKWRLRQPQRPEREPQQHQRPLSCFHHQHHPHLQATGGTILKIWN